MSSTGRIHVALKASSTCAAMASVFVSLGCAISKDTGLDLHLEADGAPIAGCGVAFYKPGSFGGGGVYARHATDCLGNVALFVPSNGYIGLEANLGDTNSPWRGVSVHLSVGDVLTATEHSPVALREITDSVNRRVRASIIRRVPLQNGSAGGSGSWFPVPQVRPPRPNL